ncbi:MAG: radical SAM protein [Dehalococcoidia bacterium]
MRYHVDRIIFNFADRCNLGCAFCYVPFDGRGYGDLSLWQRIIAQCEIWRPRMITFEGGDPFNYCDFPLLLQRIARDGLFVQVDSNALGLRDQHIPILKEAVNLVSLPLEGPKDIHSRMRNHHSHFDIVLSWIERLLEEEIPVKVNTVVTSVNIGTLEELALLLRNFPIDLWTLYQFWPIGPGKTNRVQFELPEEDFAKITSSIAMRYTFTRIEVSRISNRLLSYFFVRSTGSVYVVRKDDPEEYVELGSAFDHDILDKWLKHVNPEAVQDRTNLRMTSSRKRRKH